MKFRQLSIVVLTLYTVVACKHPDIDVNNQVMVNTFVTSFPKSVRSSSQIIFDASDNLYLSDNYGNRIWKIAPDGSFSVFAGSGEAGFKDGPSDKAQFYLPQGLIFDSAGNLYVSQLFAIRKITPDGVVSTIYGAGIGGLGFSKSTYDTTRFPIYQGSILFQAPGPLLFDKAGNLLVAEGANDARLLKITPDKQISVLIGQPFNDQVNSTTKANYFYPSGLGFDTQGNLIISDPGHGTLVRVSSIGETRYLTSKGYANTWATSGPFIRPNDLSGVAIDQHNNSYVCEDRYIEKISSDGTVSKVAGSGKASYVINGQNEPPDNGSGDQVRLFGLKSPVFDSKGNLFVLEAGGIRKITF